MGSGLMKTNKLTKTIILPSLFLLLITSPNAFGQSIYSEIERTHIDKGAKLIEGDFSIERRKVHIIGIIIDANRYQLNVSGLNQNNFSAYSLYHHTRRTNSFAGISGGFRSPHNLPHGLVVVNGRLNNRIDNESSILEYILTIKGNVVKIIHRDEYNSTISYDHALQSGPLIVKSGGFNAIDAEEIKNSKPESRAFIAIQKDTGKIILAKTGPVYLFNLAEFLRASPPSGLNCDIALNLEGGGHESFYLRTVVTTVKSGAYYSRRPNAITVKKIPQ
jgi:uncharacterized protein YigE (DUF2233 family)